MSGGEAEGIVAAAPRRQTAQYVRMSTEHQRYRFDGLEAFFRMAERARLAEVVAW